MLQLPRILLNFLILLLVYHTLFSQSTCQCQFRMAAPAEHCFAPNGVTEFTSCDVSPRRTAGRG